MTDTFNQNEHSHTRLNILNGEWILVSPHRTKRPWQGKTEAVANSKRPAYDEKCYLCPGNSRADGSVNPNYTKSFAFTNDYSSLLKDTPKGEFNKEDLLVAYSQKGICRVISFSPAHDKTLPDLTIPELQGVIEVWKSEFTELSKDADIKNIQIFENKGDIMGCSNPHPHGQIWAQNSLPVEIAKETRQQKLHFDKKGTSLLSDYIKLEQQEKVRLVYENEHFVVVIPFWATWPYETMIVSKRHITSIVDFTPAEEIGFADALKTLTMGYDLIFNTSFPYSAGMHQAPVNDGPHPEWHWHMHFFPPLLRSATIKKFMVGYELLANAQRDITAEAAAETLRECISRVKF